MADQDPASAHPVPNIRVPDIQVLVQDLAQSRRDLFEERRNSQNRIAEERERSRWEAERLRKEFGTQIEGLKSENTALVRTVGRLQAENDHLREENAILRHAKTNGAVEEKPAQVAEAPAKYADVTAILNPVHKGTEVPIVMSSSPVTPMPSYPVPTRVVSQAQVISPLPPGTQLLPPGTPLPPPPTQR